MTYFCPALHTATFFFRGIGFPSTSCWRAHYWNPQCFSWWNHHGFPWKKSIGTSPCFAGKNHRFFLAKIIAISGVNKPHESSAAPRQLQISGHLRSSQVPRRLQTWPPFEPLERLDWNHSIYWKDGCEIHRDGRHPINNMKFAGMFTSVF